MRSLSALLLLAGAALAACGVPLDERARVTPAEDVPFDLLDPTTTTVPTSAGQGERDVCLTLDGSLLTVGRDPEGSRLDDLLLSLVSSSPTQGEARLGLRSALGEGTVTAVSAQGGTARLDLDPSFAEMPADQQLLAFAQATCTLTAQPQVFRVSFLLDGDPVEVPVQSGALVDRPVTRSDYARFFPN